MNTKPDIHQTVRSGDLRRHPVAHDYVMVLVVYLGLAVITQSAFKTITVWPSAGLALAAFLVFGTRIWPSIALGTCLGVLAYFMETGQPLFSGPNLVINLATMMGNTLAAAIALRMCGRMTHQQGAFAKFDWVASKFLVAIFVFGFLSALPGVGVYWLIGQPWPNGYLAGVTGWVISDSVGALVITPLLVKLWMDGITPIYERQQKPLLLASLGLLVLVWFIFGPGQAQLSPIFQQPSFILIPLVFVAVTSGQALTFLLLTLTFFAVWVGTSAGYGPFISSSEAIAHASMQAFIGFSATVILLLQALVEGHKNLREQWAEDLRQHNLQLEKKIEARTTDLKRYKDHLEEEVQTRTADLILARDAAEAANKAKSTFLTSMNHELRTPLNAILGFSSLMRRDASLTEAQTANLDIINRSGSHLLTLINDILEIAKIEAGKTQLNIAPFDLAALVRDVTDMMELRAGAKGLQLLLDQSSEFPHYINGDEARLRQILINLLGNAVKFTQQGGVTLRLGTKQNSHSHLIIEIEDSGSGLSVEDQQRLFQPFVQFGKQPGDNKGTGLGLSITRQFVQLMGGTISVESTLGKGSLFRVDLPLSEVHETALLPQQETAKGEVIGLAPGQPLYRILIVEDQRENHLLLSQLMQRLGFEVKLAKDGKQGVQLFQSWQPHLIFMDRRMPVMDGMEATQAIRQLPEGNAVKIVAVTASAFTEQRDEMLAAGMDDFVSKPYRFNEIFDSLSRQLGVQYTYAEARDNTEKSPPVALTAKMLTVLSPALRSELRAALESLDSERINTILQLVKPFDATLHQTLSRLVDNFDYPSILKVMQTNGSEAPL